MMLLEPSPDVYQIAERAQRHVVVLLFELYSYPQTGAYPSSVSIAGGRNSCPSL